MILHRIRSQTSVSEVLDDSSPVSNRFSPSRLAAATAATVQPPLYQHSSRKKDRSAC